jgi:hypothetical protein
LFRALGIAIPSRSATRTVRRAARYKLRCEELEVRQLLSTYLVGLTDPNATWHSIDEVNNYGVSTGFLPGDQILFESGQTFTGTLSLISPDQVLNMGTPAAPITIGSYDPNDPSNLLPAPATISSGAGVGILVYNAGGYHVTDLNVVGGWTSASRTGNNSDGINFDGNLGASVVLPYVHIDHVNVSGYGSDFFDFNRGDGILFGEVYGGIPCAYNNVSVTDSVISNCVSNGIYSRAAITNLLFDHVQISSIYGLPLVNSGYGIHMWNLNGAVIQRCEVFNTGIWGGDPNSGGPDGSGGPVGIDVSNSSNVLIQYNDSHNNRDHAGFDGDGFDLDEHTTNSIMQYNFSHDNDGTGYMLGTWLPNGYNTHNIVRYNVSENDCRYWNYGAILVETPLVTDADIYNNTVFVSPNVGHNSYQTLSAIEIPVSGQTIRVRNNIFETTGGVPPAVVQSIAGGGVLFQGNDYYASGWVPSSSQPLVRWGISSYKSLAQWSVGTSEESLNGTILGTQGDPQLIDPGVSGTIDNLQGASYVPDFIDQLGALLANYYGPLNPLPGVDLTALGVPQWDLYSIQSQGGSVSSYWIATQDFASHAYTWGGGDDPHTTGAFQFSLGAPPGGFAIAVPPTTLSGTPLTITVNALDSSGRVNPAYAGTIRFSTSDVGENVVLPGDYSYTALDAGQHTFVGVALVTPGDQVIAVTDVATQMTVAAIVTVLDADPPGGGSAQRSPVERTTPAFEAFTLVAAGNSRPLAGSALVVSSLAGRNGTSVGAESRTKSDPYPNAGSLVFAPPVTLLPRGNVNLTWAFTLGDLQFEPISQAVSGVLS